MTVELHGDQRRVAEKIDSPKTDSVYRVLDVDDVQCYEHNPRLLRNPEWDAIKASIRASGGVTEPLSVTLRPGDDTYVVSKGGNTRLLILKELLAETQDERYRSLEVRVEPFTSELDLAAHHDRENNCRGDLTYFEQAWSKYRQYELYCQSETGKPSAARFIKLLNAKYGEALTPHAFSRMRFSVEVLYQHIPTCLVQGGMSQRAIRQLISFRGSLEKIWIERRLGNKDEFADIFCGLLARQDRDLAASFASADRDQSSFPDARIAIDWHAFREDFAHELTIIADVDHQRAEAWIAPAFRPDNAPLASEPSRTPSATALRRTHDEKTGPRTSSQPTLFELRAHALCLARRFAGSEDHADSLISAPDKGFGYRLALPSDHQSPSLSLLAISSGSEASSIESVSIRSLSPSQMMHWADLLKVQARIISASGNDMSFWDDQTAEKLT